MHFKKFSSIENSHTVNGHAWINKITFAGFTNPTIKYIVQEKIHGANFSFWTNGKIAKPAKRSGFLKGDLNKFFKCKSVFERYKSNILYLHQLYVSRQHDMEVTSIGVFGEIFGGYYPHESVANFPDIAPVHKKGILYCPNIEFIAFDIYVTGVKSGEPMAFYMNLKEANKLLEEAQVPYLPTLFEGSCTDCLKYSNHFETTIPAMFQLPPIVNNMCEGVVIKPVKELWLGDSRVIIKNKNDKWSEGKKVKSKPSNTSLVVSENGQRAIQFAESLLTESRLQSAVSKIGNISRKNQGLLFKGFNKDVWDDFQKESAIQLSVLEQNEREIVEKVINKRIGNFIKKNLASLFL